MDECTGESGEQYQQAREQYQLHDFLDLVVAVLTQRFVSLHASSRCYLVRTLFCSYC